jgi:preprotein translocase subunit SecB
LTRSLLQLDDSWVNRLEFRAGAGVNEDDEEDSSLPRLSWEIKKSSEEPSYLITLRIVSNTPRFHLLLDMSGTFSFLDNAADETQQRMISINGPAILYGVARGIVAGISGLTPVRRQLLPSVNVVALVERRERQQARQVHRASHA